MLEFLIMAAVIAWFYRIAKSRKMSGAIRAIVGGLSYSNHGPRHKPRS